MNDVLIKTTFNASKLAEVTSLPISTLPSGAKLVFLDLVMFADFSGKVSISQRVMSSVLGMGERQVRRNLKLLRDQGFISKTTNDYGFDSKADFYDVSRYTKGGVKEV